jgi:alpha-D-xyloside xylohydrolase
MPYIYSLAAMEVHQDYTMFRNLAFDFRQDAQCLKISDQFMFGPALMVCPVTRPFFWGPNSSALTATAPSRRVYLPGETNWYDFWTGEVLAGGQWIDADAPLEKIPLYVKEGSILPMAGISQFTGEASRGPWQVRVYPGRDGHFAVYEDSGDGYEYEREQYLWTDFIWNDKQKELARKPGKGSYAGTAATLKIEVLDGKQGFCW